jgi:hypothetical protein
MFTSKEHLHFNLGVDLEIAAFFVDRRVPPGNMYWKNRYLYVAGGTGFLFIPLFFDLQFRMGADKELILDENYVQLMEDILDSAARYEFEQISFEEHIRNCRELMKNKIKNERLYHDLENYFKNEHLEPFKNLGTFSKALNRGDSLLFSLCFLDLPQHITDSIIEKWYALVPSFLLMDDIMDLKIDKEQRQENSINDFGEGNAGVENAIDFLRTKFAQLKSANPRLGSFFENSLEKKLHTPYLQSILNS